MVDPSVFASYDQTLQYAHWKRVIRLVVERTGPYMQGFMAKYNDPNLLVGISIL